MNHDRHDSVSPLAGWLDAHVPVIGPAWKERLDEGGRRPVLSTVKDVIADRLNGLAAAMMSARDAADQDRRERAARAQRLLTRVSSFLSQTDIAGRAPLQEVAELVVDEMADACIIYLVSSHDTLEVHGVAHRDPQRARMLRDFLRAATPRMGAVHGSGRVIRDGKVEILPRLSPDHIKSIRARPEPRRAFERIGARSMASIPLIAASRPVGAIVMVASDLPITYEQTDAVALDDLGRRLGMAVQNAELYSAAEIARERAERAADDLIVQRNWLERILDKMPAPLLLVDPESAAFTFANRAANELLGGAVRLDTPDNYAAFHCTDPAGHTIVSDDLPVARALRGENVVDSEICLHTDRGKRWLLVNTSLVAGAAGDDAIVVSFEDVTRIKSVEVKLREAVSVREDFLSIASHELRTPLTTLRLQMDSLARTVANGNGCTDAVVRRTRVARRQIGRIERLVDQLLDVSRIAAGRVEIFPEETDLADLVGDVVELFRDQRQHITIDLVTRGDSRGFWDRMRMDQVATNLISNAIKYGEGKPISVTVDGAGAEVILAVKDHGVGIDHQDQEEIFSRFSRLESEPGISGLGLGLWIVKKLVTASNGTIQVASAPGKGATFTVHLPRG